MKMIMLLVLYSLTSCSGLKKKENEIFDAKSKDNETFFINAENDKHEKEIEIEDERLASNTVTSNQTQERNYTVVEGDTLGIIAVKIFGDFRKWKHIYMQNIEILQGRKLKYRSVLRYQFTGQDQWERPKGEPYLVLRGENLGIIAKKVYNGKTRYWKYILKNNKKLIYNPNLIFSGTTLYYLPINVLASLTD